MRPRKWHLASDTACALFSRLAPKMATTGLFIILMRSLGESVAGTYSLSVAFLTAGVLFSSFGMEEVVVREIAKEPILSWHYLYNMFFIRIVFSLTAYSVIGSLIFLVPKYDYTIRRIILIQSLGLFPEGITATSQAIFNATKRFSWMALSALCTSIFQLSFGLGVLNAKASLEFLVWILLLGSILTAALNVYLSYKLPGVEERKKNLKNNPNWRQKLQIDWTFCRQQLKLAFPFASIITLTSLDLQADIILLSALHNVEQVGLYSAARSIVIALALLPQAFRMAIYPSMVKAYVTSEKELRIIYQKTWKYLALVGMPIIIGGMIISPKIVDLIYGDATDTTHQVFSILMIQLMVNFLYIPSTRLMIVSNHQSWLSLFMIFSLLINVLTNVLLATRMGAAGTAMARAISLFFYFVCTEIYVCIYILPHNRGVQQTILPIASAIIMGIVVHSLRQQSLPISILAGAIVYGFIIATAEGYNLARRTKFDQH